MRPGTAGGATGGKRLPCPFACHCRVVRRGRMHAARETPRHWPSTVCMVCTLHCRAGDLARRSDDFPNFKNNTVRRGQDPALQTGENGHISRKPRSMAYPCREAYMPPLQIRVPRTRTQKRCHRADGHVSHNPRAGCRRRPRLAVRRGLWYHKGSAAPPFCAALNNQKKVHFLCPIRN